MEIENISPISNMPSLNASNQQEVSSGSARPEETNSQDEYIGQKIDLLA